MFARTIRKSALKQSVSYEEYRGAIQRDGIPYKAMVTLVGVRMEIGIVRVKVGDGVEVVGKARMFVSPINTSPNPNITYNETSGVNIVEKSKVTFNEEVFHIKEIKTEYANGITPHHWELILE